MRGDEESPKGVEQKVHAAELVVRSYISLRIMAFNTSNSVSPSRHEGCIAREEDSPLWGKGERILPPHNRAFGNVRCGDQAFPLLLVEVFHPQRKAFLRILERI